MHTHTCIHKHNNAHTYTYAYKHKHMHTHNAHSLTHSLTHSTQAKGFHSLSYFDIGNWGLSVTTTYRGPNTTCGKRSNGMPAPCPDWAGGE